MKFGDVLARDDEVLKHIGLYRVSLRAVIEDLYFDGRTCDHVIQRLLDEGRISAFSGLPGSLSYYQLTLSEARRRLLPDDRTRPHKPAALRRALAVLWYCCTAQQRRLRLERHQLGTLFGRGGGFGRPHVAELASDNSSRVYRVFAPGDGALDGRLVKTLRREAAAAAAHARLGAWVQAGTFGFAVLVPSEGRRRRLAVLLERLPVSVPYTIEVVPDALALPNAIRELQQRERRLPNE